MHKNEALLVIVCGDDVLAGREVEDRLAVLGHAVETGGTILDDIIDRVAAVRPDLVVVACRSPGAQGFDLVREIQRRGTVPLILLADERATAFLAEARSAGASWVLRVPVESTDLAWVIDMALVRHQDILELRILREKMKTNVREVVHRFKNDLAVIAALLHFQADSCTHAETTAAILECADRVGVISALYDVSRSSQHWDRLCLDHYLEVLLSKISQGLSDESGIAIEVTADYLVVGGEVALNCGLIVRELVANAIRHAFRGSWDEKLIRVALLKEGEDDLVEISVQDNGIGLPADIEPALATTFGFQLVSFLAGQLKGTVEVDRSEGTVVRVRFQAPQDNPAMVQE